MHSEVNQNKLNKRESYQEVTAPQFEKRKNLNRKYQVKEAEVNRQILTVVITLKAMQI